MAAATLSSIIGAILNIWKEPSCFIVWMASNFIFIVFALKDHNQWMALVFITYFTTSLGGLILW